MGKPSLKSRKSSRIRKKNRKCKLFKALKSKEEEIGDLQAQMHDFKKLMYESGENILDKLKKCSRENDNLVEWLKLYDKQIKENEKEIYNLNLQLYFSQPQQHQQHHQQPQQQQPQR